MSKRKPIGIQVLNEPGWANALAVLEQRRVLTTLDGKTIFEVDPSSNLGGVIDLLQKLGNAYIRSNQMHHLGVTAQGLQDSSDPTRIGVGLWLRNNDKPAQSKDDARWFGREVFKALVRLSQEIETCSQMSFKFEPPVAPCEWLGSNPSSEVSRWRPEVLRALKNRAIYIILPDEKEHVMSLPDVDDVRGETFDLCFSGRLTQINITSGSVCIDGFVKSYPEGFEEKIPGHLFTCDHCLPISKFRPLIAEEVIADVRATRKIANAGTVSWDFELVQIEAANRSSAPLTDSQEPD